MEEDTAQIKMIKLYFICSMIYRITLGLIAILIFILAVFIDDIDFNESDDVVAISIFCLCISNVLIITLFHKIIYPSWLNDLLQFFSISLVNISIFGTIALAIIMYYDDVIAIVMALFLIVVIVGIPLMYFLIKDEKYSRKRHFNEINKIN